MRTVAILAAGRGSRLVTVTGGKPKCTLEIDGRTLLEHQVQSLRAAGVDRREIVVVSGHMRAEVERLAEMYGCRSLYNPDYATTNNIMTVYRLAASIVREEGRRDEVLLVNSDTYAHPEIFRALLNAPSRDCVVVDDVSPLDAEAMKVRVVNGAVELFSKSLPLGRAHGEYIGLARLGQRGFDVLWEALQEMVSRGQTQAWYEDALNEICDEVAIAPVSTKGLPWIEIDTPDDYELAKHLQVQMNRCSCNGF